MTEFIPPDNFDGYQLLRCIGRGGMGSVYAAHDTLLDREVAIKFIALDRNDASARQRFLLEAKAIARLAHPNVVAVYRVGFVEGVPYLVSEFVRGRPLDQLELPMAWRRVLEIGLGIARGLAVAHTRGVIHRDIKPANVILSDEGEPKLLDFGIAKLLDRTTPALVSAIAPQPSVATARYDEVTRTDRRSASPPTCPPPSELPTALISQVQCEPGEPPIAESSEPPFLESSELTRPGAVVGTPAYMPPEAFWGEPASFRWDVYSLGALMYKLCTGRLVNGGTVSEIIERAKHGAPVPIHELAPDVDPALCAVIGRCLSRDPQARFSDGNELRAALSQLTPEARVQLVPEGNPYRGLASFEAEHRGVYFGRDSETRSILERLKKQALVIVVGDSGVGKSSLCRAGVLPRAPEFLGDDRSWRVMSLVPGKAPSDAVVEALTSVITDVGDELRTLLKDDTAAFVRAITKTLGADRGVVLFVDQLEELLTLASGDQSQPVLSLLGFLTQAIPGVRVLATVRGDFLSRFMAVLPSADATARSLYFLRPLNRDRLREAILGPARAKGVRFESDDLVDTLVESTARAEGGLPVLQFALAELWDARDQREQIITEASLEALGGVEGALSRHADEVVARMSPEVRDAAQRILLRLVTSDGTRARRSEAELVNGTPARRALDALVEGRLLVARDTPEGGAYEIAHEALIRAWGTLSRWRTLDANQRFTRERLHKAAAEWERLGKGSDLLWSPRQLSELDTETPLEPLERAFLTASRRALRLRLLRRVALALLLVLLPIASYVGVSVRARAALDRRVSREFGTARKAQASIQAKLHLQKSLEAQAYELFERARSEEAEATWRRARALDVEIERGIALASERLEAAAMLAPARPDVRHEFAMLLLERALRAEARSDGAALSEALSRLALYDAHGELRKRFDASGWLTLESLPPAELSLERYVAGGRGTELVPLNGKAATRLSLRRGSYLAVLRADGRVTTRFPFVIERGENLRARVMLPPRAHVPAGFVYVPAGSFFIGSADPDPQRQGFFHAAPLHRAHTAGFLIAEQETTFEDWLTYLRELDRRERRDHMPRVERGGFQGALSLSELSPGTFELTMQPAAELLRARSGEPLRYPERTERASVRWEKLPVVGISSAEAESYAAWLSRTGRVPGARLCSELEWEHAARGADRRLYPHGEQLLPDDANFDQTYAKNPRAMGLDEVSSHPSSRSAFGVDDMAGNVWEWTRTKDPVLHHAARGGSFYFDANVSRVYNRETPEPSFRDVSVGMRVCADLPEH